MQQGKLGQNVKVIPKCWFKAKSKRESNFKDYWVKILAKSDKQRFLSMLPILILTPEPKQVFFFSSAKVLQEFREIDL